VKKKPTIAVYTLGCRANQFDSESVFSQFERHGYVRVPEFSSADVHLVNTCTVTNKGDNKSRRLIKKIVRRNTGRVIVTGCSAQQDADAILRLGADFVVDNANKKALYKHVSGNSPGTCITSNIRRIRSMEQTPVNQFGNRARAHLKIQDGCNQYCTYCIIPHVRGRSRSLVPDTVLQQLEKLISNNYREIVLTGIHVGHYSSRGIPFSGILHKVLKVPGDFRIRLSAIEPGEIDGSVLRLFRAYPQKLCRHLHVSIQSGSDHVLTKMKRGYDKQFMQKLFSQLTAVDEYFGIGIDAIVGFPGETEADFRETLEFIRSMPVCYGHVFRFSPKKGTPAAEYPGQIPERIKKERSEILRSLLHKKQKAYLESQAGSLHDTVFETSAQGLTSSYIRIRLKGRKSSAGERRTVRLSSSFSQKKNEKFPVADAELAHGDVYR
jgi:threonylcarbamoyladenosine tRNA methylthiotransferase MtaB